ncbi:hypothetical protein AYI69_g4609 [Smittium culicis]|uniref:Uncharacterized protein n=1 Tax=Smittium culicis TaxID=133412 RepID=A0A1R1XB84_9FUNG|nr:hypothetical protein AYI69_g9664 [Smittium culicis]OMJ24500.1 hypothetical protein AYI69_g4609 [Smittium culicis]
MVKFDQNTCDTMLVAGILEFAARIAPIARAFGFGVLSGLSMRVDKFLIYHVFLSTVNGLFRPLVLLKNIFTNIGSLLILSVG